MSFDPAGRQERVCRAHADRSSHKDHRCANAKTISERKVLAAVVGHLLDKLSRPDRVQVFTSALQKSWADLVADGSPTRELEGKIEQQRATIANVMQALVAVPASKALADKMAAEERALADLEAQLQTVKGARPTILPHPSAIARYVKRLAELLERGDVSEAGAALRAAFQPFRMVPGRFRGDCSERTFLFRIAHNRGLSHVARRRIVGGELRALADKAPGPEARVAGREEVEQLFAALRELHVPQRQVLTLALEGMDLAEVGACLGITAETAAVRLSRARAALRQRLRGVAATRLQREGP